MKKTPLRKKSKTPTHSKLVKDADTVFSEYIRRIHSDQYGYVICYTCGKRKHWKTVDAGHFQGRASLNTRWDEMNVKPQCKGCNLKEGEKPKFSRALQKEYGHGILDEIIAKSNQTGVIGRKEILEITAYYKQKLKEMNGKP